MRVERQDQIFAMALGAIVEYPHLFGECTLEPADFPELLRPVYETVAEFVKDSDGRLALGHLAHRSRMHWHELDNALQYPGNDEVGRQWIRRALRTAVDRDIQAHVSLARIDRDDPLQSRMQAFRDALAAADRRLNASAERQQTLDTCTTDFEISFLESLKRGKPLGFDLGFKSDRVTGLMAPGDLWVMVADPGAGKTTFALQWARRRAAAGDRGIYLSGEMNSHAIGKRQVYREVGKSLSQQLDPQDLTSTLREHDKAKDLVSWVHRPRLCLADVRGEAERLAATEGRLAWIVVDNLKQLARSYQGREHERFGQAVGELRSLTQELGVPALVLHHLNRDHEGDEKPKAAHIRGSVEIVEDADALLALTVVETNEQPHGAAKLWVLKCRQGQRGWEFPLRFNAYSQSFYDETPID